MNIALQKFIIDLDQASQDLIGKPVEVRRGPATVTASDPASVTVPKAWEDAGER